MDLTWPLPLEVVHHFVSLWGGDPGNEVLLRDGTNTLFRFRGRGKNYVLRIHRTGDRQFEEIVAEIDWVDYLYRNGVKVNRPFRSSSGQWVETLEWDDNVLYAAVFNHVPGKPPQLYRNDQWDIRRIRRIGRTLGRMHALNQQYQPPSGIRRSDWTTIELPKYAEGITPPEDAAYLDTLGEYWEWMLGLPTDDPNVFGLVHGDYQGGNMLATRSKLTVIDFDSASYNFYLFDIAHCTGMHAMEAGPWPEEQWPAKVEELFTELIRGYLKEHKMASDWFEFLANFLMGFQLMYYFNLLARFQFDPPQRLEAPHCEFVRTNVLQNRPFVDLDFRTLYKQVEIPAWVSWLLSKD